MNLLRRATRIILEIIFPPICLFCGKELPRERRDAWLCGECRSAVPVRDFLLCAACGARLPEGKKICHREIPYRLAAASDYENPIVRTLVWKLKYRSQTAAARPLAALLAEHLTRLALQTASCRIIPIPLHPARERRRGFNHAALIGKLLHEITGIPVSEDALRRTRRTRPQADLKTWEAREENMKDAFAIGRKENLSGSSIILLDDVTTSGATLREAAGTLKAAGVRDVIGLVAARASR